MIGPPGVNLKRARVIANRGITGVPLWVSGMRIPLRNKCVSFGPACRLVVPACRSAKIKPACLCPCVLVMSSYELLG